MPDDSSLLLVPNQRVDVLTFETRTNDDLEIRRKLCGRGAAVKGSGLGFCGVLPVQDDAPWIALTVDGAKAAVQVNWGQLRRFAGLPLEGLSPDDIALILEDKAADWLEEFEKKTGLAVRLTGVRDADSDEVFSLGMTWDGLACPAIFSQAAISVLSKALPIAQQHIPGDLGMALRVEIGAFSIKAGALGTLSKGDALAWEKPPETVRLIAQDSHSAAAKWSDGGLEITSGFQRMDQGEHLGMASELEEPQAEAMDDLDVRVSVRAGEALITLGDLKKLGAGSILPMSKSDGDGVDLVVNGRRIGTGQLVRVGGAQAVEIKELFSDG